MKTDVFLYGRTVTHDYYDMYLPQWISTDSEEYSEYRRTVSFIMKIRDILPEGQSEILKHTSDSFVFFRGRKISMLCRFCHVCGTDQFGRPICSTEGYAVKNENLREFWSELPEMILCLSSAEKSYYEKYISSHSEDEKYDPEILSEETGRYDISSVPEKQFDKLTEALKRSRTPFSFAFGPEEKKLYNYSTENDSVKINVFFASDECTELPEETEEESCEADFGEMKIWVDIRKSPQGRLRFRLAVASNPGADRKISEVPYLSYERESGSEIKISELFAMYETVKAYTAKNGIMKVQKKCIPFNSDIDTEYSGKTACLEYRPPAEQKRSLLQIIKGVKPPDFTEHIIFRCGEKEIPLLTVCELMTLSDDSESRLISYEKIMEAAV